ncbi:MAG: nicotinamide-nucleotide adenylyltransferase [Desulfurococcaceae archaeon]
MADNMNTRRVLFPGRFQPFHLGHQAALEQLLSEFDEVIVAIGSSQEGFTCKNPFTAGERFEMIARFVVREGIRNRVWITTIPDINMPPAWSAYVLSMVPPVEAVASGNPQTLYLFEWLGFKVKKIRLVEPEKYHGTRIRDLMIMGNDAWKELVPSVVVEFIDEIRGVERVRRLCTDEHSSKSRW